ncbi:MAG: hypothetical protein D6698_12805 [Gammaproteobacteria bacterium]|nr:MAG: hypothetical protein D6698_12805 [Gammaproteobacteria bacterium]
MVDINLDRKHPMMETTTTVEAPHNVLIERIMPAESELKVLQEEEQSFVKGLPPQKFFYLEGIFLEGEVRNGNGRIYPRKEIETAVQDLKERIRTYGPVAGQLDHPNHLSFDFLEIAVAIIDVWMNGNNGEGKMRVIPEGRGKIVEGALKAGIRVGVSSRGQGDVDDNGVVSNYKIITIDVVLNPSAPHAYPTATLAESMSRYDPRNELVKLADATLHDKSAEKHFEIAMRQFLTRLNEHHPELWRKK